MAAKYDLIGLTGYAQSGKDTVGKYLVDSAGFSRVAFADAVRDAVYTMNPWLVVSKEDQSGLEIQYLQHYVDRVGWDVAKVECDEARRLLQVMGTEVGRMLFGENVWVDIAARKRAEVDGPVVITDVRFENEAKWIRKEGGVVIRVDRPGVAAVNTHSSENLDFEPDFTILNWGSLDDLYDEVDALLY